MGTTTWSLSELGRKVLESDIILDPGHELTLRVIGMMDRPTTRDNILRIVNQLMDDFDGPENAIEAIKDGAVELEWNYYS